MDRLLLGVGGQCYIKFLLEHLGKKLSSIPSWHGIYEKLKRASSIGNQECVKAILNRFEDTESRDPTISSKLLHYAVETGDYDLVNLLIKNGANVGIQDRNGKTALHYAAASNKDEIVRLLLKEGANEEIKDKSNETFLAYLGTGASETKSFLFNVLHQQGLLYHAAMEDNIDRAKRLLAKGKDINAKNSHCESPLSVAIERNCLQIVKLFLEEKAKIGKEEVKKAIRAGNLEVIKLLVRKNAVITEKAIQYAQNVYKNCKEDKKQAHSSVLKFLEKTSKDQFEEAIKQGNLERIKFLVEKGAVITEEIKKYAQHAYKDCKKKRVYIANYPGGMKAERQNRKEILGFSTNEIPEQEDGTQTTTKQQEMSLFPYMQNGRVLPSGSLNPIAGMENTQNLQSAILSSQQLAFRNVIEISNKHGREDFTPLTPTPVPTPNLTPTPNPIPTPTPEPTPQPTPALKPTLIPSVANNKSEQVNDTQTNGKLPNNPGNGSITATQNTQKSNWPTVATWTFAVAGILAGAAATGCIFCF